MSEQTNRSFFEQYADAAMEQQRKYGIPASITLAQMACESGFGESRLARTANNYFGVKGTFNGQYVLANDDKPNEKFKRYDNVSQSIEDHSKFLMGERYKDCLQYDTTDYHNWIVNIKKGGYATDPNYVSTIESIIKKYDLAQYDLLAKNNTKELSTRHNETQYLSYIPGYWSLPVTPDAKNQLQITSDYGLRSRPTAGASQDHKGIDISVKYANVYATEDHGKVIEAGHDKNGGGNYVKIAYDRPDGTKYHVSCLHMSQINVQVGDPVNAGQQIGVSGESGIGTGPHLDFRVKKGTNENDMQYIDPKVYLAEIEVRGGLTAELNNGNKDLLADYKTFMTIEDAVHPSVIPTQRNNIDQAQLIAQFADTDDPLKMMQYMMQQNEDESFGISGDILSEVAGTLFKGMLTVTAMLAGNRNVNNTDESTRNIGQGDETAISNATLIERQRESVDIKQAKQLASMNYDSMIPEISQSQGQHLA